MEPFYIRQTAEPRTQTDRRLWVEQAVAEARGQGAKLFRCSYHPDNENLLLVEAWNADAREVGDQGAIRWSLTT